MKLVSLYANNFKKLNFDSPVSFKTGVTVISGLNEAGKSTVLDAILYALFGRVTRPPGHVKDDDLLAYQTKRGTVILEFEVGGETYRVTREINRTGTNKSDLYRKSGSGWKAIAVKSRDVSKSIEGILGGISFEEMLSSNIVAQKDLGRLVDPKSDRWKVVNAFLHLESFTEAAKQLNDEKNDLEGTGVLRPGTINNGREKLKQLKQTQAECNRRKELNVKLAEEVATLTTANEVLARRRSELEALERRLKEYEETAQKKERLEGDAKGQQEILNRHREVVSSLEPKVLEAEAGLSKFQGLPSQQEVGPIGMLAESVKLEGARLEQFASQISSKEAGVRKSEEELKPFNPDSIQAVEGKRSMKGRTIGLVASLASAAAAFALNLSILPWVLLAVSAVFAVLLGARVRSMSRLVELEDLSSKYKRLEEGRKELVQMKGEYSAAEQAQADSERRLIRMIDGLEYYKGLDEGGTSVPRSETVVRQHAVDLEARKRAGEELGRLRKTLEDLRGQLDEAEALKQIEGLRSQAAVLALPTLPDGVVFSKEILASTTKQKEDAGNDIASNKATVTADKKGIGENEGFLRENSGIDEAVATQDILVQNLEHQLLVTKLAKEGVEETVEAIKAKFRPGVASHMGEILPALTMQRYKSALLDDDFGMKVWDPEAGEYRPRGVFSGGTDDQFLLAMRLAFVLSLLPEAKGTKPDFLWLDEPLGSSDELRRSGIVDYLDTGLTKSFSQIFIVSHVGGLEEQVANVIRLENGKLAG